MTPDRASNAAAELLASMPWLMLASVAANRLPHASYFPFALLPDGLGIVASGLASHTRNLIERGTACVLLVADAPGADGDYARPRIAIDVHVRPAPAQSETAVRIWSALEQRQGQLTATLRTLPDFMAFVLAPIGARLVAGFAAAHDLDSAQTLEAIRIAKAR